MSNFANISIRILADLKQFSSQMQNANRDLQKLGQSMDKVGKGLSLGLTAPLAALGFVAVENYDKQAKAIAQVEAGLKSTKNAVGYTSQELQKFASDLQDKTIFGDEEILQSATSQLLTFTNIAGDQFQRTQLAALDLATRLDGDLKSASIQLGKALNDPVANLSALSRSGIQFSEDQKSTINALASTNRLAEAQTLILDELANQYGGSAEAAAKAGKGGLTQLSNILGDITEDFGKIILEAIAPFIEKLKGMAKAFQNLTPEAKKTIAIIATIAGVIGPLLITLGFMMTTVIPGLITAFGFLSGTALPAVITAFRSLNVTMLANPIVATVAAVAALTYGLVTMLQKLTPAVSKMQTFFNLLKSGGNYTRFIQLQTLSHAEALMEERKAAEAATKAMADLNAEIAAGPTYVAPIIPKLPAGPVVPKQRAATTGLAPLATLGVEELNPFSALQMQAELMPNITAAMSAEEMKMLDNALQFNEGLSEIMGGAAESFATGFAEMIGSAASGGISLQGIGKFILSTLADVAINVGKMAIKIGFAVEGIKKALTSLGGAGAIAAGIALIALGTFAKTSLANAAQPQSRTAFAKGGLVYGPTNALIGEYVGASNNPEVVAPLNTLKGMLGETGGGKLDVTVKGVVKGRDLHFLGIRTQQDLNRKG